MKAIILAGGLGTRLGAMTEEIPKPMVEIGGQPILWHIMMHYARFGIKDFVVALGYKAEVIKSFFINNRNLGSDINEDLSTGDVEILSSSRVDWRVSLVDTGLESLTGERLRRLSGFIGDETFMLTYGDGLSNVNLDKLLSFHRSRDQLATMTAVRPAARFGELRLSGDLVSSFEEKPQLTDGWINGGFFVMEPDFIKLIPNSNVMLEKEPFERAVAKGELSAFRHEGFWQCMDTKRDWEYLNGLWNGGSAPWLKDG